MVVRAGQRSDRPRSRGLSGLVRLRRRLRRRAPADPDSCFCHQSLATELGAGDGRLRPSKGLGVIPPTAVAVGRDPRSRATFCPSSSIDRGWHPRSTDDRPPPSQKSRARPCGTTWIVTERCVRLPGGGCPNFGEGSEAGAASGYEARPFRPMRAAPRSSPPRRWCSNGSAPPGSPASGRSSG